MDTAKFLRMHSTVIKHRDRELVSLGYAARRKMERDQVRKAKARQKELKRLFKIENPPVYLKRVS